MAFRLFFAVWLRTPVQGSTPFATCWSQENASGSDFTSQYCHCLPNFHGPRPLSSIAMAACFNREAGIGVV